MKEDPVCADIKGVTASTVDSCKCGTATCKKDEFCTGTTCLKTAVDKPVTQEDVNAAKDILTSAQKNELSKLIAYSEALQLKPDADKTDYDKSVKD